MGQHTHIVWLWIDNNSHCLGPVGLDGVAEAVLCSEAEMELGSGGNKLGSCCLGNSSVFRIRRQHRARHNRWL